MSDEQVRRQVTRGCGVVLWWALLLVLFIATVWVLWWAL